MTGHDLADERGVSSQRVGSHDFHQAAGIIGRNDGDQLALVGDIERVEPQHLARSPHLATDGNGGLARRTPTFDAAASSFKVLDTPPRVGSRMARIPGQASSIALARPFKGAVSLSSTVSNSIPSRTDMMAMPWSPIVPDTTIWSPGRAAQSTATGPAARHRRRSS